jgi:hypothetical protein
MGVPQVSISCWAESPVSNSTKFPLFSAPCRRAADGVYAQLRVVVQALRIRVGGRVGPTSGRGSRWWTM